MFALGIAVVLLTATAALAAGALAAPCEDSSSLIDQIRIGRSGYAPNPLLVRPPHLVSVPHFLISHEGLFNPTALFLLTATACSTLRSREWAQTSA